MLDPKPNAEQVKALREESFIGLYEAQARLEKTWAVKQVLNLKLRTAEAKNLEEIKEVMVDFFDLFLGVGFKSAP